MPRHLKVHELLSREELDKLEAFTREPGRTVDECETWLAAEGFVISRGAVWAWRTKFLSEDKFRASSDVARSLLEAAKSGDVAAISDAATLQLGQMLFEQLLTLQSGGAVETKELWAASMALKNVIGSKRGLEKLQEDMARTKARAIEEADKAAKGGASGEAVVAKVREILGIAA